MKFSELRPGDVLMERAGWWLVVQNCSRKIIFLRLWNSYDDVSRIGERPYAEHETIRLNQVWRGTDVRFEAR